MRETIFDNAMAGDRVYCSLVLCEERKTTNAFIEKTGMGSLFQLLVQTDTGKSLRFNKKGEFFENEAQVLFWSKPEFVIPVRPKRKKIIEGYVGVCVYEPNISGIVASLTNLYENPDKARDFGQTAFARMEIVEGEE